MDFCFLRCVCIGMFSKVCVWWQAEGRGSPAGWVGGGGGGGGGEGWMVCQDR